MGKLDVVIDGDEENVETLVLDNTLQQLTCDNVTIPINPFLSEGAHTIRIQPNASGRVIASVSTAKATPPNVAYIHTKQLQMKQREEHGFRFNAEKALLNADKSSVPFED